MNSTDKKPDYKAMYEFTSDKFKKTKLFYHGPFDETYYTLRVYETAKEIIKSIKIPCKKQVILTSAILHDIGKSKLKHRKLVHSKGIKDRAKEEWFKHAELGVPIAKKFLGRQGHSQEFIGEVCYLIRHHDHRGVKMKDRSIELKILQDADFIADVGLAGFIRPFLYAAKFYRSSITTADYMRTYKNVRDPKKLNLAVSKKMLKEKQIIENGLVKRFIKNTESDLL